MKDPSLLAASHVHYELTVSWVGAEMIPFVTLADRRERNYPP